MRSIQMFLAAYGNEGGNFLDALGVRQVGCGEINLMPGILDIGRAERGKESLMRLE